MSLQINIDSDSVTIVVDTMLMPGEPYFKEFENLSSKICDFDSQVVKIDLLQCKYMDTRAISVILEINGVLKKAGKVLKLVNVNEEISDLLRTIKLNKIIELS